MNREDIHNSGTPRICQACEARHRGVCGALTPDELITLSRSSRQTTLEAGQELMGESEPATSYANVMSGVVKLTKMLSDGRQQIVGLQFAPDFLGRPFASEYPVTAEAGSEVGLCRFSKSAIDKLIEANKDLEHHIFQQTLTELDDARDWMLTLGRKTASEKIASFLCLIASHIDPLGDPAATKIVFDLPLTRADIADYLGLTIETVSRQFTKLRAAGVLEIVNNRHVTIPDIARLRARSG